MQRTEKLRGLPRQKDHPYRSLDLKQVSEFFSLVNLFEHTAFENRNINKSG